MNSLLLFPAVISFILHDFYWENRCLQILGRTVTLKLVPRPFRAQQKFFFVCIKFDKAGNSLPKHFERTVNIRSNL